MVSYGNYFIGLLLTHGFSKQPWRFNFVSDKVALTADLFQNISNQPKF